VSFAHPLNMSICNGHVHIPVDMSTPHVLMSLPPFLPPSPRATTNPRPS
jgi:hypothetical protein